MKQAIDIFENNGKLTAEESYLAFKEVIQSNASESHIISLLTGINITGIDENIIIGAIKALKESSHSIKAPDNAIDVCGTGGDGKNTLNISTAVSLILASNGIPVAKHGNRAISSKSGSFDVLEKLGIDTTQDPEESLRKNNICFMFAPDYYKALADLAPIRKSMERKTIFNLLGPLLNPANVKYQLIGTAFKDSMIAMALALRELGTKKAWIVHGADGIDEISTTGINKIIEIDGQDIKEFELDPREYGFNIIDISEIQGGDASYNADMLLKLLDGEQSAYRDIVILNTAAALYIAGKVDHIKEGVNMASNISFILPLKNT